MSVLNIVSTLAADLWQQKWLMVASQNSSESNAMPLVAASGREQGAVSWDQGPDPTTQAAAAQAQPPALQLQEVEIQACE